jgi:hypothetical protein
MTNASTLHREILTDRIGLKLAARLDETSLPHDISERLRVARLQAVSQRKKELQLLTASSVSMSGSAAVISGEFGGDRFGWLQRLAGAVPLVALAVGLVFINVVGSEEGAAEVADVDMQLLTDDLPPAAHTDPGFAQYLKFGPPQQP